MMRSRLWEYSTNKLTAVRRRIHVQYIHDFMCMGVWGRVKRTLTHHPTSQDWAPRYPIQFVSDCIVQVW